MNRHNTVIGHAALNDDLVVVDCRHSKSLLTNISFLFVLGSIRRVVQLDSDVGDSEYLSLVRKYVHLRGEGTQYIARILETNSTFYGYVFCRAFRVSNNTYFVNKGIYG